MPSLSDVIEEFIKQLFAEAEGTVEIQRNELAIKFRCVPSQINYVITTRFNNDRGYFVESKRGGGGNIRIRKVNISADGSYLMHIITTMGQSMSQQYAEVYINNFFDYNIITEREAIIMKAAISDRIMANVDVSLRDTVRATLLKNMLTSLIV